MLHHSKALAQGYQPTKYQLDRFSSVPDSALLTVQPTAKLKSSLSHLQVGPPKQSFTGTGLEQLLNSAKYNFHSFNIAHCPPHRKYAQHHRADLVVEISFLKHIHVGTHFSRRRVIWLSGTISRFNSIEKSGGFDAVALNFIMKPCPSRWHRCGR